MLREIQKLWFVVHWLVKFPNGGRSARKPVHQKVIAKMVTLRKHFVMLFNKLTCLISNQLLPAELLVLMN